MKLESHSHLPNDLLSMSATPPGELKLSKNCAGPFHKSVRN